MPSFSNIPSHQTTFPHGPLLVLKGTFFLLSLDKFRVVEESVQEEKVS